MTGTRTLTAESVLADIREMLHIVLGDYDVDDLEITVETTFHTDLGLESIDLVEIGSMLAQRYGEHVNLAAFLSEMEIDDVIEMRIGLLVDFVLSTAFAGPRRGH